jgi:hypothetical protein
MKKIFVVVLIVVLSGAACSLSQRQAVYVAGDTYAFALHRAGMENGYPVEPYAVTFPGIVPDFAMNVIRNVAVISLENYLKNHGAKFWADVLSVAAIAVTAWDISQKVKKLGW